ncbi:hypothetical protein LOC67_23080 [Stieleria sp. JC731]|uniref:hypothetical protein n=1 Tax=Pirellulaceae TaxID=2691357 RepID=UPI001E5F4E33|nr:hypothetical protein [Stieleria sp. JC731]MCC9603443.1 hypothetical protein [Stieleria sp. JC731]
MRERRVKLTICLQAAAALLSACLSPKYCHAQSEPVKDRYSLVLIQSDLDDANKTLAIFDLDDDGVLNETECKKLKWASLAGRADLNRNQLLSQPEIALHFASIREELDVEQIDRTVAERSIRKHDSNRNGQIDPEEITAAWPEEPDEIDANADGILTVEELTHAFAFRRVIRKEIGIIGVDQGWAIKIRNRFDRDGDGRLGPSEWEGTPMPAKPDGFDEDEDGLLSLTEIATMIAKHRQKLGLTPKDLLSARALMQPVDANFDGIATKEELALYVKLQPAIADGLLAFDTDGDGKTTMLEIEKEMGKRRDEKGYTDQDAAEAQRLMLRHDVNRDRVIRSGELKEKSGQGFLGKEVLPQADRDDNKAINQDELARYLARQREQ